MKIKISTAVKTAIVSMCALVLGSRLHAQDLEPVPQKDIIKLKAVIPDKLPAKAKNRKTLVFWRCEGYVHGKAIEYGLEALKQLAVKHTSYKIDFTKEYNDLSATHLEKYDALVLMNTTRLNTKENFDLEYDLINFVKDGKGLTVIHAGADNFYAAEAAAEMIGGRFWGHPWTAGGTWSFKVEEPDHPLNRSFSKPTFKWGDEIYQQQSPFYNRAKLRVLVSLDMNDEATKNAKGQKREDEDNPVSWIRPYGKGRVFYTSFAHDQRAWLDKKIFPHIIAGLQYTLGDLKADDTPVGLSNKEIASIKSSDELSLFKAFALLQDTLRNTHNKNVHKANLSKIIPILSDSSATPQGRQAVLRALISCGIQPDAETIAPALKHKETRNWAITLLTGIESRSAEKLIASELNSAEGADKITLINAMVIRGESDEIIPLMNSKNPSVAIAAISGVGRIADEHALEALLTDDTGKHSDTRYTALAAAIGTMAKSGSARTAAKAAEKVMKKDDVPDAVLAACAKARLLHDPDFYMKGVRMSSVKVREALIRHADDVDNKVLAASIQQACTPGKVAIITKLASKNARECAPAIAEMLKSDKPEVVAAALKALAKLGKEQHVAQMFAKLHDENDSIRQEARNALEDMCCPATSSALIKAAGADIEKQKSVLQLIGRRMKKNDIPALAPFIESADLGVRQEAWKALSSICDETCVASLMALLPQMRKSDAPQAASAVNSAVRNLGAKQRVKTLAEAWNCDSPGAKAALVDVMLRYSDDSYVPILSKAMRHPDKSIAEAAIRALGRWPTFKPYNDLVCYFKPQNDANLKTQAFRSALKLAMAKGGNHIEKLSSDLFKNAPSDKERNRLAMFYYKEKQLDLFPLLKNCFNDTSTGACAKKLYLEFYNEKVKNAGNISGGELSPKGWKVNASHNGRDASKAIDRNEGSRWTSGQSKKGMWFTIDLGRSYFISEILLDTSGSGGDTPNGYKVFVSNDVKKWGNPVVEKPQNNDKNKTVIKMSATGSHVKIELTGTRPGLHWSIHEIHIKAGIDPQTLDEIRKTAETL